MKKLLLYIFIAIALSGTVTVHAQNEYVLLEPLPCIKGTGNGDCSVPGETIKKISLDTYIGYVFKFSIALAVFLAVVMITIGGFKYMLTAIPSAKVDARNTITNAVMGLAAALASYLILQTIDPRLVNIDSRIEPICNAENKKTGGLCDTKAMGNFLSKLEVDLKNLSTENRLDVVSRQNKIDDLEVQKSKLESILASYGGTPEIIAAQEKLVDLRKRQNELNQEILNGTGGEIASSNSKAALLEVEKDIKDAEDIVSGESYKVQLAKIDEQIQTEKSKNVQTVITGTQQEVFRNAINELHKKDIYNPDGSLKIDSLGNTSEKTSKLAKENIENVYQKWIDDKSLSPDDKQKLLFEKQFYTKQIDKEGEVYSKITKFSNTEATIAEYSCFECPEVHIELRPNPAYIPVKTDLEKTKIDYTNQLTFLSSPPGTAALANDTNDLVKIKNDPVLLNQYKTILNDRLNNINSLLIKKK